MHARLGHASLSKIKYVDECGCNGLENYKCDVCALAKHQKLPFSRSESRADGSFKLVHMDLWGPYRIKSLQGASYFLTILDDHSRCTWTYLLHNKGQVEKTIRDFIAMVRNKFEKEIKVIRSDNGTEIGKEQCVHMFKERGIMHQTSVAGPPQQNGRVMNNRRKNPSP